jgi:hypothetical protein
MIANSIQLRVDSLSGRKAGHLDQPATQILSRNTTRGIEMKRIPLTQGKYAIVDDGDYKWLSQWKWYAVKSYNTYYAVRAYSRSCRKPIYMHKLILNPPDGFKSDHRNNNGLDNRRQNLRICTNSQNSQNKRAGQSGTSQYKGVYWHKQGKRKKRWVASIMTNYKPIHLGYFQNEIEAARAYDKEAKELFGEFAYTNF